MKLREVRCEGCYVKITQQGSGRTATLCKACRDRRNEEWRAAKARRDAAKKDTSGDNT